MAQARTRTTRPLHDRALFQRIEETGAHRSGTIIGDRVLFGKYSGSEAEIDGEE